MRVGAVDLGTNSTRLLVADVRGGELDEAERLLEITRLGDRVDTDGRLSDASMARVHAVLDRYAARARGARRRSACSRPRRAPSATRRTAASSWPRSAAGTASRRGSSRAGRRPSSTYRGVTSRLAAGPATLVCDIGGGSTELVLGGPDGVIDATSLDIGCVRMSERCLHSDPPAAAEVAALRDARSPAPAGAPDAAGPRGSSASPAPSRRSRPSTSTWSARCPSWSTATRSRRSTVEALLARLAALPLAERRGVRGLMPERAPTIVAGTAIARGGDAGDRRRRR